jgi:exosome complex component RRP4
MVEIKEDNDSIKESSNDQTIETKREIVVPGELLDEGILKPGIGTYQDENKIYAAQLGIKNIRSNFINVISLTGPYIPKASDNVIGMVVDILPNNWIIDINSPYSAPLQSNEVPWRVEFGETSKYLTLGDIVLLKILFVDEIKRISLSMRGPGLRKLNGGQIISISPLKVPRVIGKSGSMIGLLKKYTNCHLFVGQNGRIWLDGSLEEIMMATSAINIIERNAHISGLTSVIEDYLKGIRTTSNADFDK